MPPSLNSYGHYGQQKFYSEQLCTYRHWSKLNEEIAIKNKSSFGVLWTVSNPKYKSKSNISQIHWQTGYMGLTYSVCVCCTYSWPAPHKTGLRWGRSCRPRLGWCTSGAECWLCRSHSPLPLQLAAHSSYTVTGPALPTPHHAPANTCLKHDMPILSHHYGVFRELIHLKKKGSTGQTVKRKLVNSSTTLWQDVWHCVELISDGGKQAPLS